MHGAVIHLQLELLITFLKFLIKHEETKNSREKEGKSMTGSFRFSRCPICNRDEKILGMVKLHLVKTRTFFEDVPTITK